MEKKTLIEENKFSNGSSEDRIKGKGTRKKKGAIEPVSLEGSVGSWEWNVKSNRIRCSQQVRSMYGIKTGEANAMYEAWERFSHRKDLQRIKEAIAHSVDQEKDLDIEFCLVWPDKSISWMFCKAHAGHQVEERRGIKKEPHQRTENNMRSPEMQKEDHQHYYISGDNAPVMIWMADVVGQPVYFNRAWLAFTGKTLERELTEGWKGDMHPEDVENFFSAFTLALDRKQEFSIECRLRRYDGHYRWVINQGVPNYLSDRTFVGFTGSCVDVSERIEVEKQKDEFMRIASHELKTPVTSIKAYAQILQAKFMKEKDPESAGMLMRMDAQIDKLTHLIVNLLDVSKIESGALDLRPEKFSINAFIYEIVEEMQRTTKQHKITPRLNKDVMAFGDQERLGQVLTNLISNAIKYSPQAEEIIVAAKPADNEIVISVRDFGMGIPEEMTSRIFERFYRARETKESKISGLGLGLYIAAEIVKQHGGKIWVESSPNKGSEFYFTVPASHNNVD